MQAYKSLFAQDKKLLLAFLFLGLGVAIHINQGFSSAWYLYVAAVLLLAGHLLFGNIWSAFRQMKQGKISEAHQSLQKIQFPNLLFKTHRAYYYFIQGMIALQRKQLDAGKQHLAKAINLGLRNANDTSLAKLNLAHIHFVQKDFSNAQSLVNEIKTLQPSDLLIKEKIKELEKAIS